MRKLAADKRHVSNADVDLHLGANVDRREAARSAAGATRSNWRIDAPQLAALGPDFGGALRGSGTLSGTMDAPSLTAALEGQNLRADGHATGEARCTPRANLGSGRGAADPLALDVQLTDYASARPINWATQRDAASPPPRLRRRGTRGAHTMRPAARGDGFDAALAVHGG